MPMDPQHVAAAIEHWMEQEEKVARGYDHMARHIREQIEFKRTLRKWILEGYPEEAKHGKFHLETELRKVYREVTGVIVMGD